MVQDARGRALVDTFGRCMWIQRFYTTLQIQHRHPCARVHMCMCAGVCVCVREREIENGGVGMRVREDVLGHKDG